MRSWNFYLKAVVIGVFVLGCNSKQSKELLEVMPFLQQQTSPATHSIRGISVVDSNFIWLSGAKGTIVKTEDGGQKWELLASPDGDSLDFRSIEAFNDQEAIVVSAGFPARIYKTNTAGEKWELVYENKDSAAFMNSLAFKNRKEGVVVGDQLEGRHLILKTIDGGSTWQRVDSTRIPKPLENENGFAASGSCIAIKDNKYFIGLGGGHSRVFSSKDGSDWSANESNLKTDKNSSGIYSISSGRNYLMAVGGDYTEVDSTQKAVISSDGINWLEANGLLSGYRSVVDYSEACDCWLAGGSNGVEVSFTNGKEWKKILDQDINTLRFAPKAMIAIAADKNGGIFTISLNGSALMKD